MKSPRHRWNCVAMPLGLPYQADRLSGTVTPDPICRELARVVTGKVKIKAIQRAYDIYQSDSARMLYDSVLFATLNVGDAARILVERADHMKTYADCFFDVAVFQSLGDRVLYLDRFAAINPSAAGMLRNAMQLSTEDLTFLSDKSKAKKVSPKDVIETTKDLFFAMMNLYIKPQMEEVMLEAQSDERIARYERLHSMAKDCGNMALKSAELLIKYELDKSAENFLEEFAMKLAQTPAEHLIAEKGDGKGLELV